MSRYILPNYSEDMWDRLRERSLPLYLYGTGDGADKILSVCSRKEIQVEGFFVSDDFYRGQSFHGTKVRPLSELMSMPSRCIVAVAFGSALEQVLSRVSELAQIHEVLIPDVPVAGGEVFDLAFYRAHKAQLEAVMELLADDASRNVLRDVIAYKLSGSMQPLMRCVSDKEEVFRELIPLDTGEHYVDCGAYRGDTVQEFLSHIPAADQYGSVTAFEPDPRSFRKLRAFCEENHLHDVCLYQGGVSDTGSEIFAEDNRGRGTSFVHTQTMHDFSESCSEPQKVKGRPVCMYRIDDLALHPTYLKMDVEGFERQALTGAAETISRCRPSLNIACYHRSGDLFILPALIKEICPDYALYLRRHSCIPCWELNLYAAAGPGCGEVRLPGKDKS